MANTLGTLSGSLILQQALSLVFVKRPILRMLSFGFVNNDGTTTALYNQAVTSRIKSVATVNNFGTGATDRADTDVSITLNTAKEIHHNFTLAEINSTDRNLIMESAEPIAVGFANHMVDALATQWTTTNFGAGKVRASNYDYEWLVDLRKEANANGVPEPGRFLCVNGDVYAGMLKDSMIVSELNNATNLNAIQTGRLPVVQGFAIMEYPSLTANGENRVGFYGSPETTAYASRAPRNPEEVSAATFPGLIGYVQEPTTGLTWMVNEWIDPDNLSTNLRIVWYYGMGTGNTALGDLIVTA